MATITIDPNFGYVLIVGAASYIMHNLVLSSYVMSARKKYNVKYPALYATEKEQPDEKQRNAFNCVQRGHQNALENYTSFNTMLLLAGAKYPLTAAIAGATYLLGRVIYMHGYATGQPAKRQNGALFIYPAMLTLLGCVVRFGYTLAFK